MQAFCLGHIRYNENVYQGENVEESHEDIPWLSTPIS